MKKFLGYLLAAVVLFCLFFFLGIGRTNLTPADFSAIDKAYAAAEQNIDKHTEAVRQAVLARKKYSAYVAGNLTGWTAAWTRCVDGEEGLQAKVNKEISANLISEQWSTQLISKQLAAFVLELREVEDALAQETGCYGLSTAQDEANVKGKGGLSHGKLELTDAMQKQLLVELTALVGGEVAAQLILSSGILATGSALSATSFGVSLGVGIVVDLVVRWVMNPSGKVEQQLNEALDKAAEEHAQLFRKALETLLQERRNRWKAEISDFRSPL